MLLFISILISPSVSHHTHLHRAVASMLAFTFTANTTATSARANKKCFALPTFPTVKFESAAAAGEA